MTIKELSNYQERMIKSWIAMSLRIDELWARWKLRIKEPTRDYLFVKITGTWWPPWLYITILVRPLHRGGYRGVCSSILDMLGYSWSFVGVRSTRPRPVCDRYFIIYFCNSSSIEKNLVLYCKIIINIILIYFMIVFMMKCYINIKLII